MYTHVTSSSFWNASFTACSQLSYIDTRAAVCLVHQDHLPSGMIFNLLIILLYGCEEAFSMIPLSSGTFCGNLEYICSSTATMDELTSFCKTDWHVHVTNGLNIQYI